MAERGGQRAGTLSGGEQQMLALGRALMSRPRLLLLDEPSLGLAPMVVREFFRIVRAAQRERGAHGARGRAGRAHRAARVEPGLRARGRPRRAHGHERRARGTRVGATELPRLLMVVARLHRLHAADRLRPRVGRRLRPARSRARDHPSLDGRHQLRAGGDGDALHLHRVERSREPRLAVLARLRRDAADLVRRRRRASTGS